MQKQLHRLSSKITHAAGRNVVREVGAARYRHTDGLYNRNTDDKSPRATTTLVT